MDKTIQTPEYAVMLGLLRQLREAAGLRQADLAERLGEPQPFVSKIESGQRRLDVIELRAICEACGTTLIDFTTKLEDRLQKVA